MQKLTFFGIILLNTSDSLFGGLTMKTVAFKEEEFAMVQTLLQNHLDTLTEDEFFTHNEKTDIYHNETVCKDAIHAMGEHDVEEVCIGLTSD